MQSSGDENCLLCFVQYTIHPQLPLLFVVLPVEQILYHMQNYQFRIKPI